MPLKLNLEASHLGWLVEIFSLYVTGRPLMKPDLERLLPSLSLFSFAKDEDVVKEGEESKELFIVFSGLAGVSKGDELLAKLWPGDLFGEIAFLGGGPRTATVRAIEDSEIFRCEAAEFTKLIEEYPELKGALSQVAQLRVAKLPRNG